MFGGSGDELQLVLNLPVNRAHYLAMARRDARRWPRRCRSARDPRDYAPTKFLRNHDALNHSHMPEAERNEMLAALRPA